MLLLFAVSVVAADVVFVDGVFLSGGHGGVGVLLVVVFVVLIDRQWFVSAEMVIPLSVNLALNKSAGYFSNCMHVSYNKN